MAPKSLKKKIFNYADEQKIKSKDKQQKSLVQNSFYKSSPRAGQRKSPRTKKDGYNDLNIVKNSKFSKISMSLRDDYEYTQSIKSSPTRRH